jgi:hypothetical protein
MFFNLNNMNQPILEAINILQTRSQSLKKEYELKTEIEGLNKEQNHTVRTLHMGEAQGIDLAIETLKTIFK